MKSCGNDGIVEYSWVLESKAAVVSGRILIIDNYATVYSI